MMFGSEINTSDCFSSHDPGRGAGEFCTNNNNNNSVTKINSNQYSTEDSIKSANFRIFHNNCRGLNNKKLRLMHSRVIDENDIILLSETMVSSTSAADNLKSDFSNIGKRSMTLSLANKEYHQGSIVIWDPRFLDVRPAPELSSDSFEINSIKVVTKSKCNSIVDSITVIYCYKSPSMDGKENEDYITELLDIIERAEGRMIVLGDLNWIKGRRCHGVDEGQYLELIQLMGFKSQYTGPTRLLNQLDYIFSNFPLSCDKEEGLQGRGSPSDHCSLVANVLLEYEILLKPRILLVTKGKMTKSRNLAAHQWMLEGYQWLLEDQRYSEADIDTIFGLSTNLLTQTYDHFYQKFYRVIPERKEIRGFSRQQSQVIFNNQISPEEKERQLRILRKKDFARKTKSRFYEKSHSLRLRNTFALNPKVDKSVACNLEPELFGEELQREEQKDLEEHDRGLHDDWTGKNLDLVVKEITVERFMEISKKMRIKWKRYRDYGFCERFWWAIARMINTDRDLGISSYSNVKTVIKDRAKLDQTAGFRPVWEPCNPYKKLFDLLKTALIDIQKIPNTAYAKNSSTVRAITIASCWNIGKNQGVFGIDLKKAFNRLCRTCLNDSIGYKFVPPDIECCFRTERGMSGVFKSMVGSGAGRPSGGNLFNLAFYGVIRRCPLLNDKTMRALQVTYADDSLALMDITIDQLETYIEEMKSASKIGLKIHSSGPKGPCLLVQRENIEKTRNFLKQTTAEINVASEIKFLGLDWFISKKYNCLTASIPPKMKSTLNYLVQVLKERMQTAFYLLDDKDQWVAMEIAGQSCAAFIESRIMMAIMFASREDVEFMYGIHRRMVAALTAIPLKFFNFTARGPTSKNGKEFVPDILQLLCGPVGVWSSNNSGLQSKSYLQLCRITGRPPLSQIARRIFDVIEAQTTEQERSAAYKGDSNARTAYGSSAPFIKKLNSFRQRCQENPNLYQNTKPKLNKWYQTFKSLKSKTLRQNFIKFATDRGMKGQKPSILDDDNDSKCRLCGEDDENTAHFAACHSSKARNIRSILENDPAVQYSDRQLQQRLDLTVEIAKTLTPSGGW